MPTHPEVMSALQKAHDAEASASEKFHKQEHAFTDGDRKVPKLAKWFEKRHEEAADRQHDLRGHMMRAGGEVKTMLGDTSYSQDPGEALKSACKTLDGLSAAYRGIHDASEKHGDRETAEKFHGVNRSLEKTYHKGEQKQQMLKDLGPALFQAKHS